MSAGLPSTTRHGTHRASHLRQVSTSGSDTPYNSRPATATSDTGTIQHDPTYAKVESKCVLWVHDDNFSKDEVVLNLSLFPDLREGDTIAITAIKQEPNLRDFQDRRQGSAHESDTLSVDVPRERSSSNPRSPVSASPKGCKHDNAGERRYMFVARDMTREQKVKSPTLEISIAKNVADVFGFRHRASCVLSVADLNLCTASHVEMAFRDEYLARSDMWRLTIQELTNKTIYKGQKILFMGTIRVSVTAVYIDGRKVHSAFFSTNTKPIFRSESARYVLFIQMSREMWDFDSEGSGEIMFNKVVNGFLPALFKKWAASKAKHLVSIVLFTRVQYDTGVTTELGSNGFDEYYHTGERTGGSTNPYKDFYRVVVSEMASGSWTTILYKLKREFKFFRRDFSLHRIDAVNSMTPLSPEEKARGALGTQIEAEPSLAMYGNVLEAINLASSQFAQDYIDRDLIRTGISVVVITPCAGLFEVDYETLRMTTENLVGNGIGIDLVCLPKMPLHSVPLFKYRNPEYGKFRETLNYNPLRSEDSTPKQSSGVYGASYSSTIGKSMSPSKTFGPERTLRTGSVASIAPPGEWSYAIPHWVDVSFWTGASQEMGPSKVVSKRADSYLRSWNNPKSTDFAVRCKMYELEMASVMENAMTEILITPLQGESFFPLMLTGPREVPLRSKKPTATSTLIKRTKAYAGFHEFVGGPSKPLVDRHVSEEFKRFAGILDAFDLDKSQIDLNFHHIRRNTDDSKSMKSGSQEKLRRSPEDEFKFLGTSLSSVAESSSGAALMATSLSNRKRQDPQQIPEFKRPRQPSIGSMSITSKTSLAKSTKVSSQLNFGKHGFSLAAPIATALVTGADTLSAYSSTKDKDWGPLSTATSQLLGNARSSSSRPSSVHSSTPIKPGYSDPKNGERNPSKATKPLTLHSAVQLSQSKDQLMSSAMLGSLSRTAEQRSDKSHSHVANSMRLDDSHKLHNTKLLAGAVPELPATLSPTTSMSPWLTVLNPANPAATDIQSQYRRWHHIFPRKIHAKTMKWKSLCCPASVPLTTSDFPTKHQLETEYQQKPYNISHGSEEDLTQGLSSRDDFLRELIGLRLSHGFQIVVGSAIGDAFGQKSLKIANVFDRDRIAEEGASVFMSLGNTIHQLSCVNETEVEINVFVRKPAAPTLVEPNVNGVEYFPAIQTTLAANFDSRKIILGKPKEEYNWNYVDTYLAGYDEEMTENLRFWRARFVLIPVQRPSQTHRKVGEDNEEEVRLEGIKKLTQIWQRHRVFTASEQRDLSKKGRRDPNPLNVIYKTEDPSVVVTQELEATLASLEFGPAGRREGQLIETERFRKGKFDIAALAAAMQAPIEKGGVPVQDRMWHWRNYRNCFIGLDMTTWLIENFADINTREEAVDLGNRLMVKDELNKITEHEKDTGRDRANDIGIFLHVEKRHAFRDGQYFYQIIGEHSRARPESRGGWFSHRKRDASVPATPVSDSANRDLPRLTRSRSSSQHDDNRSSSSGTATPTASVFSSTKTDNTTNMPRIALSKVMRYDVDHRKRSYRPERINLHYDMLHNPDNCYHIRIDWMSVTAKLIEDTISSWASTAERYGLRLVEAPIGEACSITDIHPFRSPYHITLALQPPDEPPAFFSTSIFGLPEKSTHIGRQYYHKHIMKKFNFVLDIEAAKNFPSTVDVTYSWGKVDFKYTQYIHRSGILLAQITDDGNFLLLANRLYNNRTAAAREAERNSKSNVDGTHHENGNNNTRSNTRMSSSIYGAGSILSDRTTPVPSPALRPTLTTLNTATTAHSIQNPTPNSAFYPSPSLRPSLPSTTNLQHLATSDVLGSTFQPFSHNTLSNSKQELLLTPEVIKSALEDFCSDRDALKEFYQEVLDKATQPQAPTPPVSAFMLGSGMGGGRSPSVSSVSGISASGSVFGDRAGDRDRDVPVLGLPPGLLSRDGVGNGGGGSNFKLGGMPSWGRRASVQVLSGVLGGANSGASGIGGSYDSGATNISGWNGFAAGGSPAVRNNGSAGRNGRDSPRDSAGESSESEK